MKKTCESCRSPLLPSDPFPLCSTCDEAEKWDMEEDDRWDEIEETDYLGLAWDDDDEIGDFP